jgi:hypothetical protein
MLLKNTKIKIYKSVIFFVVLNVYETWSLTMWEEHKLRVFESRVLRKVFGLKRDEVTEEWGKKIYIYNEELNDQYSSPNIFRLIKSRRMRWARNITHMGERRDSYIVLVWKPEGKRPV